MRSLQNVTEYRVAGEWAEYVVKGPRGSVIVYESSNVGGEFIVFDNADGNDPRNLPVIAEGLQYEAAMRLARRRVM